jgi:hypothetical protein
LSAFEEDDIIACMSKAEIIAELPRLSASELAEVQAKLDELVGETWHDHADLTENDQSALNAALAEYQKNPDAGSGWDEVKARVQSKLRP